LHLKTHDFARFAFGKDLKRPAADLAIGGESLGRDAGIDYELKALPAKGALNGLGDFHETMIRQFAFVRKRGSMVQEGRGRHTPLHPP
jgi:hypothetical protein